MVEKYIGFMVGAWGSYLLATAYKVEGLYSAEGSFTALFGLAFTFVGFNL